jgi:ABC-type transport system substrate-binding protein
VEVFYDDPREAVNDLLRGEIDVLDQLYPGDARRYQQSKQIKLGSYALPSMHMLVPISDHPYLAKDKFRRALMYSTNRGEILRGELINSDDLSDGRLVSGPFPVGINKNDPLNYAYDPSIEPMPYDPRLAKLLLYMVEKEIAAQSLKLKVPVPENKPLRLAVPNFELARVAAQALIQQWELVGIKAEMVLLPEGRAFDTDLKCDLAYVTATMWEPAIDIERLLGGNGPASSSNAFIVQGLTRLRQARSWRETRIALQDLHRLVDDHLPLMPLWQITDRFAYSPQLQGLKPAAVSLYDNVAAWRLVAPTMPVTARSSAQ